MLIMSTYYYHFLLFLVQVLTIKVRTFYFFHEVEKEARELQAIRRKHQGDNTFRFWECDYRKREVRVADHPNY